MNVAVPSHPEQNQSLQSAGSIFKFDSIQGTQSESSHSADVQARPSVDESGGDQQPSGETAQSDWSTLLDDPEFHEQIDDFLRGQGEAYKTV